MSVYVCVFMWGEVKGIILQIRRQFQEIEKSLRKICFSEGTGEKERERITGCGKSVKVGE